MLFQLFREEVIDTSQVSLSKLKEFRSLFLDLKLRLQSLVCVKEEKREGGTHTAANLMLKSM